MDICTHTHMYFNACRYADTAWVYSHFKAIVQGGSDFRCEFVGRPTEKTQPVGESQPILSRGSEMRSKKIEDLEPSKLIFEVWNHPIQLKIPQNWMVVLKNTEFPAAGLKNVPHWWLPYQVIL